MSDETLLELVQLTDAEIARIEQGDRLLSAYHALNINEKERRIGGRLLVDDRPWTVQNLAETIGYARSGVATALADLQSCGIARRQFDGWVLTAKGLAIAITIFRECQEIREGRFDGFSEYLIRILCDLEMGGMSRPFHIPKGSIFKT
jgi:DNA-binding MarR family transcriptional regulator